VEKKDSWANFPKRNHRQISKPKRQTPKPQPKSIKTMGRLTQMVEYLNADKHPDSHEITDKYTHININSTTKKVVSVSKQIEAAINAVESSDYASMRKGMITNHLKKALKAIP